MEQNSQACINIKMMQCTAQMKGVGGCGKSNPSPLEVGEHPLKYYIWDLQVTQNRCIIIGNKQPFFMSKLINPLTYGNHGDRSPQPVVSAGWVGVVRWPLPAHSKVSSAAASFSVVHLVLTLSSVSYSAPECQGCCCSHCLWFPSWRGSCQSSAGVHRLSRLLSP